MSYTSQTEYIKCEHIFNSV